MGARWGEAAVPGDPTVVVRPIGTVRSPFKEKSEAPRQPADARGRIELLPSLAHAVCDLDGFERIWVISWLDRAAGFRAKVQPPRSTKRRGVLATRSPHRPNPLGLSALRLERVEGVTLHVAELDLLDGTPILDVKPYLAYADAFPRSRAGWLEDEARAEVAALDDPLDPLAPWEVRLAGPAPAQLAWLLDRGVDAETPLRRVLALGPVPHSARRIRRGPDGMRVAWKAWRAGFRVENRTIVIENVRSGYRPGDVQRGTTPELQLHRAFVARFGV